MTPKDFVDHKRGHQFLPVRKDVLVTSQRVPEPVYNIIVRVCVLYTHMILFFWSGNALFPRNRMFPKLCHCPAVVFEAQSNGLDIIGPPPAVYMVFRGSILQGVNPQMA